MKKIDTKGLLKDLRYMIKPRSIGDHETKAHNIAIRKAIEKVKEYEKELDIDNDNRYLINNKQITDK